IIKEIRAGYPKTAVVGFANQCEKETLAELKRAGAADVALDSASKEEFQKMVVNAILARSAKVSENILAFVPAKGGSGSTTVALNAAVSLAEDWKKTVLVLETDWHSGYSATLLGLDPPESILDALENSQFLNSGMWSRLVSTVHGFDLLPMPSAKKDTLISRWEYQRLLTFARSHYDLVIADLPEVVNEATEAIAVQASQIHVVCTPDKASLFLARRRIDEIVFRGAPQAHVRVLLNQLWQPEPQDPKQLRAAKALAEQTMAGIEKFLERKVAATLPYDASLRQRSISSPPLIDRASGLGRALCSFARGLAGVDAPLPVPPPPVEQKTGLMSLLRQRVLSQHT
ncbi:MAG TPA: AAA family ATPase, partial [Bryobacterales bacterium]|nr:AAA family ATPase [Bryobacterales bacterium]